MPNIEVELPGSNGRKVVLEPGDYVIKQGKYANSYSAVVRANGTIKTYMYGVPQSNFKTKDYPEKHGWDRRNTELVVVAENPGVPNAVPTHELREALKNGGNLLALQSLIKDLIDKHDPDMREVPVRLTVKDLRELSAGRVPETVREGAKAGLDAL